MTTKKENPKKVIKKTTKKTVIKKPVKKVIVKKEVVKKTIEIKKQIKLQSVAGNLICIINGVKNVLKSPSTNDIKIITNKVKLYNKTNNILLEGEILHLVNVKVVEKEKKEAEKKGIKKSIIKLKKETKIVETPILSLSEQLKNKLNNNELSELERKELRALLKEEKEEVKVEAPKVAPIRRSGEY